MRSFLKFAFTVTAVLLLTGLTFAQSFLGSINGTVKDPSGAFIPNAQVTLSDVGTGIQRTTQSNADGNYYFGDLPPGTYTVAVSREGFKEARSTNIVLTAQQTARFDATLELGNVSQTVEVKATAPTLNTQNAQLGDVRPREDLLNLPLNNRSTINYFFLSSFNYQGDGSSYSLGGLRGVNTNFTIDGVTSNSAVFGAQVGPMTQETFDSIREMKLLTSNNSAEFPNVGTVLIASRSGENQIHGSLFYIHANNWLNARNFFDTEKPKGPLLHDLGGSFGGPVVIPHLYDGHNRTFFYFTLEHERFPGEYSGTGNVPTLKMRTGDFSELLTGATASPCPYPKPGDPSFDTGAIFDPTTQHKFTCGDGTVIPLSNPFVFNGQANVIDPSRLSSVALKLQDFGFLQPNFGPANNFSGNWIGVFPSADHDTRYVTRFDHQFRTNDALSLRASIRDIPEPLQFDSDLPIFERNQNRQTRNAYISETHTFGPHLLNEFRVGFSRDFSRLAGVHKGADVVKQVGLQGIDLSNKMDLHGVPELNFNNFSGMFEWADYFWMTQTLEILNNLTYTIGKHTLKTGFLLRHNTVNISEGSDTSLSDFGVLNFDGFAAGFDYADFLLGLPHSTIRFNRSQPRYNRYNELGLFVEDNFQVSDRLTLNLGLRYEYFPPPVDKFDMRFGFDPRTGNLVLASPRSQRLVSPIFPSSIPLVQASSAGFPARSLLEKQLKNFGPRVGFAYRPLGNNRTVIRGGYGIYYTRLAFSRLDDFAGGPFHSIEFFQGNITNGVPSLQFPSPFPGVGSLSGQSISPVSKDLRTPYTQQWNLTVEHELAASTVARISYRGFRSLQIPYNGDINKPFPRSDPAGENFFRYPNFFSVNLRQDGGRQNMNGLDVAVERKFSQGLSFQSGWTWAKNLTDVGDDDETAGIENPYNRRAEYGNLYWMPRHRWVSMAQYDLPYGRGKRFGSNLPSAANRVLGEWQIAAVTNFATGPFLTPSFDGLDPSNTRTFGGRPDEVGDPNLTNKSIVRWFNPNAFAVPPNGRFGNSARGVIVGPGLANGDFGLFKYFTFKEKYKIQIRMTSTNFFNHPNFGRPPFDPNTDISSRNVGKIRRLQGGRRDTLSSKSREIQVGFRLDF